MWKTLQGEYVKTWGYPRDISGTCRHFGQQTAFLCFFFFFLLSSFQHKKRRRCIQKALIWKHTYRVFPKPMKPVVCLRRLSITVILLRQHFVPGRLPLLYFGSPNGKRKKKPPFPRCRHQRRYHLISMYSSLISHHPYLLFLSDPGEIIIIIASSSSSSIIFLRTSKIVFNKRKYPASTLTIQSTPFEPENFKFVAMRPVCIPSPPPNPRPHAFFLDQHSFVSIRQPKIKKIRI